MNPTVTQITTHALEALRHYNQGRTLLVLECPSCGGKLGKVGHLASGKESAFREHVERCGYLRRDAETKLKDRREPGRDIFRRTFPQARSLWSVDVPQIGTLEVFALGKSLVMIQEYDNRNGWNAWTLTTDDGRIDETMKAIAQHCGVADQIMGDELNAVYGVEK